MANLHILEQSGIKPFKGLKIEIINQSGKWYVNGKLYPDASDEEKEFMELFWKYIKENQDS